MGDGTEAVGEPLLRILHPSDFSRASRIAFAHALKIALLAKAELEIVRGNDSLLRRAATRLARVSGLSTGQHLALVA